MTSSPWSTTARCTTDRMTAFRPGQSPPDVSTPIRMARDTFCSSTWAGDRTALVRLDRRHPTRRRGRGHRASAVRARSARMARRGRHDWSVEPLDRVPRLRRAACAAAIRSSRSASYQLVVDRRQRVHVQRQLEQQVRDVRVAGHHRAVHVRAEDGVVVRALGAVAGAVAACRAAPGRTGGRSGPRWVTPWWFSKPVSGGRPSRGSMSAEHVADAPLALAAGADHVQQAEARLALAEVVDELVAEDLVAGADREDDRAVGRPPGSARRPGAAARRPAAAAGPRRRRSGRCRRRWGSAGRSARRAGRRPGRAGAPGAPRPGRCPGRRRCSAGPGRSTPGAGCCRSCSSSSCRSSGGGQLPTRRRRSWNAV